LIFKDNDELGGSFIRGGCGVGALLRGGVAQPQRGAEVKGGGGPNLTFP
jgi:hypothetical protein